MKVVLVGVRNYEPFESSDGNTVDGLKVFFLFDDDNTVGKVADSKWIPRERFNGFGVKISDLEEAAQDQLVVDLEFDNKSKVMGIVL